MSHRGHRRRAVAVLGIALAAVACTSPDRPRVQGEDVALPSPVRSLDASLSATVAQLQAAVARAGARLAAAPQAYRPSEPAELLQTPRTVLRASLADPEEGFVVIYRAADESQASALARGLADYLGSGFGQTNYPSDAQFSVRVVDRTVVFTWWSRSRSDDAERAEAVFDAVRTVGQEVEVRK